MSERDIRILLAKIERALGREWLDIAEWLRDQNDLESIEERLLAGDFAGVIAEVESAARRFAASTHEGYETAGRTAARYLDDNLADKLVRFDVTNDRAVLAARRHELELVSGLTQETRQVLRQVIVDGTREGLNPRTIARDLRDSIGLTPHQEQHVRSYRRALEQGDYANALGRQLSSGVSDRTVRRVARDGKALTERQIEVAVERYRANQIAYRAEVIARTETSRNVHAGLDDAFRQAVDRGDVEADQLVREWIHAGHGPNSRSSHAAMDGVRVAFGEPFVFADGVRKMHPGDGNGGAAHDASCRCTVATVLATAKRRSSLGPHPGEGMYADIMRASGML